ncbi:MAG TPA: DUF58 domain-containing protein [Actinomycetota bacterium]|nr:DUF58 domain-containing protein [Actinomycetota bacterium]
MPSPRRRAWGLVVGAALLFTVGTSVQAGWLLALASALLGAVIAGSLLPVRMVSGLEVERRAPGEAFQGDEVAVELVVVNRGRGVRLGLEIDDAHLGRTRVAVPSLAPGERAVIGTMRRASRRGANESSAVAVRSSAPFGVAERRRSLVLPGSTLVFPKVVRLEALPLVDALSTREHAMHAAPRRGAGPEYFGIREYRTGDSMRHVHWASTARHAQLMVREFEHERTRRLAIVLDTWADAGEEDTPLDACCSAAASVAFAALGRGRGVRLLAASDGRVERLTRAEPKRVLEWLADLRPFGGLAFADLVRALGPELRGVETVLLVLPTWRANAPERLAEAAGGLREAAARVAALLVEADSFEPDRRGPALAPEEVDALERALAGRGVETYRIRMGEDLAECLSRPLARAG